MKIKHKISKEQRKGLKEIPQNNSNTKVYPVNKGSEFVVLSEGVAIKKKIEAQLGKATIIDEDPRLKYTNEIEKHSGKLRKVKKLTYQAYFEIYRLDPIPARLYRTVKAHRQEKNYSMRTIVSKIGTPPYGISKSLVKIIKPTLNKSQHKIKDSVEFSNEVKAWEISQLKTKDHMISSTYIHLFYLTKLSKYS